MVLASTSWRPTNNFPHAVVSNESPFFVAKVSSFSFPTLLYTNLPAHPFPFGKFPLIS